MRTFPAIALFLTSSFAWAAAKPNPAEYTVSVKVVSSHSESLNSTTGYQALDVVIGGRKYELKATQYLYRDTLDCSSSVYIGLGL